MSKLFSQLDFNARSILHGADLPGRQLTLYALVCGAFYGALMGTYSGFSGHLSGWQMLFSTIKVPALLFVAGGLCLPGFFVLSSLFGLSSDWPQSRRALLLSQAALSLILASLAPFTLLFYASSKNYQGAILFNFLIFSLASFTAQNLLRRLYAPLIARDARHKTMLSLWLALFGFTCVQLAYVLRPFIGDPSQPAAFFRAGAWENAYIVLGKMILSIAGHRD
jgi:hypothetical protein